MAEYSPGTLNTGILKDKKGVQFIGAKNNIEISSESYYPSYNSYFNIDVQQSAYFTMMIEGWKFNRFHTAIFSDLRKSKNLKMDGSYNNDFDLVTHRSNQSDDWIPLKSLTFSQGSIETTSISTGVFADIALPFKKHCPTLTCEMFDHRSDFFEMKLREWHAMSVVDDGFVPVLDSIAKKVWIRGWCTDGECNSITTCHCILADDITTSRDYDSNSLKVIQFKLIVVGYD